MWNIIVDDESLEKVITEWPESGNRETINFDIDDKERANENSPSGKIIQYNWEFLIHRKHESRFSHSTR